MNNDPFSDLRISVCKICGGDHNVIIVPLENGGRIVTSPFLENRTNINLKRKRKLTPDIFRQGQGGS